MSGRSFWSLGPGEIRVVLGSFAVVLWGTVVAVWLQAPIPCGDFVLFYTLGSLAFEPERLYNFDAFHAAQVSLVPASASLSYPPSYPPHFALLMVPFSLLPFGTAVTLWSAVTITLYAAVIYGTYRALKPDFDPLTTALAAIAFPPFAQVIGYGQSTALLMGACFLAWNALVRRQSFLAGAALGLFALKPQLALPFVVIVLAGREWHMLAGAICSVLIQAVAVLVVMGQGALTAYVKFVPELVRNTDALEAIPYHTHSIRALTELLPPVIGQPIWIIAVGLLLWGVAQVWRTSAPVHVRLGFAVLVGVLVSPHLIVYDAVLLALPLFWFAQWLTSRHGDRRFWAGGALLFVAFAFSWARVVIIQPSVIVMLWMAYYVWKQTRVAGSGAAPV